MGKEAVVFVVYNNETNRVLSEKRLPTSHSYPDLIVFPSGTVEEEEKDDVSKTLLREVQEELDVIPTQYASLDEDVPLIGEVGNVILHPFIITAWIGELPTEVKDKGNALIWQTFEEASDSPVKTRAVIARRVKNYLESQK